jgi:hypothetical protein
VQHKAQRKHHGGAFGAARQEEVHPALHAQVGPRQRAQQPGAQALAVLRQVRERVVGVEAGVVGEALVVVVAVQSERPRGAPDARILEEAREGAKFGRRARRRE